jgi:hypothetical protein
MKNNSQMASTRDGNRKDAIHESTRKKQDTIREWMRIRALELFSFSIKKVERARQQNCIHHFS